MDISVFFTFHFRPPPHPAFRSYFFTNTYIIFSSLYSLDSLKIKFIGFKRMDFYCTAANLSFRLVTENIQ